MFLEDVDFLGDPRSKDGNILSHEHKKEATYFVRLSDRVKMRQAFLDPVPFLLAP